MATLLSFTLALPMLSACAQTQPAGDAGVPGLPDGFDPILQRTFDKYTSVTAPNGKPIHIFAQDDVTPAQLLRARHILEFFLENAPGTKYGTRKQHVANAMANRNAALFYFNTERDAERAFRGPLGDLDYAGQDLYATESPIEGSPEYMENTVRDASYEEIFHLVHGHGIEEALPLYQAGLVMSADSAWKEKIWTPEPEVYREWQREGSLSHEYIISAIDVYYGLWAHSTTGESFFGEYQVHTRRRLQNEDPRGFAAVQAFLPPHLSHPVRLDERFEGVFSIRYNPAKPYTLKSRYLQNVALTGDNDADLMGNHLDNTLTGNSGDNLLTGFGGNDTLIGGEGIDTAGYSGPAARYKIEKDGDKVSITDLESGSDGNDVLEGIEIVRFTDIEIEIDHQAP